MRLVFSNADEDTIDRYRDLLPRAAAAWAARRSGPPTSRRALRTVVAFKLGEQDCGGDGLVARWTAADVSALLEHWLPARRAPTWEGDAEAVPRALRTWWTFLHERGWFDPRSDPIAELERAVQAAAPRAVAPSVRGGLRSTARQTAWAACPPDTRRRPHRDGTGLAAAGGEAAAGAGAGVDSGPGARAGAGPAAPRRSARSAFARGTEPSAPGGLAFAALAAAVAGEPEQAGPTPPLGGPGRRNSWLPPARLPATGELAAGIAAAPVLAAPVTEGSARDTPLAAAGALELWWERFTEVRAAAEGRLRGELAAAGARGGPVGADVPDTTEPRQHGRAATNAAPDEAPRASDSARAPDTTGPRRHQRPVPDSPSASTSGGSPIGADASAAGAGTDSAMPRTPTPAADALIGAVLTASALGREHGAPISLLPRLAADVLTTLPQRGARPSRPQRGDGSTRIVAAAETLLGALADLGAVARGPSADTAAASAEAASASAGVADAAEATGVTGAAGITGVDSAGGADAGDGPGQSAVLTPLGWWLWFALLTSLGSRPRTHAELMAEDAEVLIDRAASGTPFGERELRQWIDARGPHRALPELVGVYRRSDDCIHRSLVNSVTADYSLQARTCYEDLRTDTEFGGWARSWLFDAGFAKHDSLEPLDHLGPLLDGLSASLRTGTYGCTEGPGALSGVSDPELPAVFDTAAGCGHPESPFVLSWFARHHPDQRIRAAARSAHAALVRSRARR